MKSDKKSFRHGLAVRRNKEYIKEIPTYRFTSNGKFANNEVPDIQHTVILLNNGILDKTKEFDAAELKAIITITEVSYQLIINYIMRHNPDLLKKTNQYLKETQGFDNYYNFLDKFRANFLKLHINPEDEKTFEYLLVEIIINWLNNINPAFKAYFILFDNSVILKDSGYFVVMQELINCIRQEGSVEKTGSKKSKGLYELLREPAIRYPDSIKAQLEFILESWDEYLDDLTPLLQTLDLIKEQEIHFGGFFPAPVFDYNFIVDQEEEEYYSADTDWMSSLVLIAKSTYVWLHQLTLKYHYLINRLDQIPDEELRLLQKRGITGLWLIGIWQRSYASGKIKARNGDHQAIASAYSIDSYRIADELGGEAAWDVLTRKAAKYRIRMGCDMVPNHTGIDSQWIVHHPNWFIQADQPPFHSYYFTGDNLSRHPEIEVRIEDHYYARTDAAVVFELIDRRDSSYRYIYHGNDGTGLPWNDTAQLDYTKEEVRQAVIDEIIRIAKKIPIIRFDAAMTLAKQHYHRLWFPAPGSGGDIPSRSQHGMTKTEFDRVFPREFWRQVVDRIATDAPDTLLLAEAFWMMEGYFVRNLGMHRVYNSAFMHTMMREDNAAFRRSIIKTLEYDKRILKRFVNFMSNPDEETAIDQFGDDDKYFGVCVLMCTLPGLPMFGHGQIEGFWEKYGMEFTAPRREESENQYLIRRHQREIFPLLKKRKLFAEADNFRLFDFYDQEGNLNENVIAFSNNNLGVHSLIFYNNSYQTIFGKINEVNNYDLKHDKTVEINKTTLGNILSLNYGPDRYLIFRDQIDKKEYIRLCDEILTYGLDLELTGYEYHVFLDFEEIVDNEERKLALIYQKIGKSGVDSISAMRKRIELQPLHGKLKTLFSYSMITNQEMLINGDLSNAEERRFFLEKELFPAIFEFHSAFMEIEGLIPWKETRLIHDTLAFFRKAEKAIIEHRPACKKLPPSTLIAVWTLFREIKIRAEENEKNLNDLIDKYLLEEPLKEVFARGCNFLSDQQYLDIVYIALKYENLWQSFISEGKKAFYRFLNDDKVKSIIRLNLFDGIQWFNKEAFEILCSTLEIVNRINRSEGMRYRVLIHLKCISETFAELYELAEKSGYDYDKLINELKN